MANNNAAYGLRPYIGANALGPSIDTRAPIGYSIASGYGSTIAKGDLVKLTGTSDSLGRPQIALAAVNDAIVGVFEGLEVSPVGQGHPSFRTIFTAGDSGTEIIAHVYDNPDQLFTIQSNGTAVAGDVGNKADFIYANADAVNGRSNTMLNQATVGVEDALIIRGLAPIQGNAFGANAQLLVQIREHMERGSAVTAYPVAV